MPREAPPMHFEYVDKATVWPRWLPSWLQRITPAQPTTPTPAPTHPSTSMQPAQSPVSFVVVNNSSRPIPMQSLMHLLSRYAIPRHLPSQQGSPNQPTPQQQTIVIVIGQEGQPQMGTDDILNRLFMAQQPQTIPTSQSFIQSLPQIPITPEAISKQPQCTVCMEEFHVEEQATQLPCLHYFHQDCIKPWLQTQHTCPMCRHELPTDSPNQISSQIPSHPALSYTSSSEQIPHQTHTSPLPAPIPLLVAPVAPLALPAPPTPTQTTISTALTPVTSPASPTSTPTTTTISTPALTTPAPSSSPSSNSSTPAQPTTPPTEESHAGIKRGPQPTPPEQASKKTKVEKEQPKQAEGSGIKRGFLLPSADQESKKKKVEEEKRETESRTRRQGGSDFGFKKGFLLR